MDFRELEYFVTIAQEKNLTRAAEVLYVSQPALTKFLQKLEQEHGIPLIQRIGKQLKLTYAGERYLYYARRLLETKHSMDDEMADIRKLDIGLLQVGMPPIRCSFSLPAVLPKFRAAYPGVRFELMEDSSSNLDTALLEGRIDLAFYNLSEMRKGLCYEIIEEDELFVILPKGHPIRERAVHTPSRRAPSVRLEWLKDETFLIQDRSQRQGQYILRELSELQLSPDKIQKTSNIRAAASLAANGYGVAFLTGGLMRHLKPIYDFDFYSILDAKYPMYFAAAWREQNYLPVYTQHFIKLIREYAKEDRMMADF